MICVRKIGGRQANRSKISEGRQTDNLSLCTGLKMTLMSRVGGTCNMEMQTRQKYPNVIVSILWPVYFGLQIEFIDRAL